MIAPAPKPPTKSPASGGALIAFGLLGGAALGFAYGQPTLGLLAGLALGIAAAIAIWLSGR